MLESFDDARSLLLEATSVSDLPVSWVDDVIDKVSHYAAQRGFSGEARIADAAYRHGMTMLADRSRELDVHLRKKVGKRYRDCCFDNYETGTDAKASAVEKLKTYGLEDIRHGAGVVLFGPKGTGKDHLALALARHLIEKHFVPVDWVNGIDFFGEIRRSFSDDSAKSESQLIRALARPMILIISDPLPPMGSLSEFQMSTLFRLLDARARAMRPTWATVNVANGDELDIRLGPQNADRLRHGALAVWCSWNSYRTLATR